ncbi:hypothetical protein BaRGS_00004995, partial [Batillaria attramentaria]
FNSSVSKDLSVFLQERTPTTLKAMTDFAEAFRRAHPTKNLARRSAEAASAAAFQFTKVQKQNTFKGGDKNKTVKAPEPSAVAPDSEPRQGQQQQQPKSKRKSKQSDAKVQCYKCKGFGHISTVCPTVEQIENPKQAFFCTPQPPDAVTAVAADYKDGTLRYTRGKVNGIPVTVVNDSGAVTAGVRKSLVRPDQYTGQQKTTLSFGGNRETFPLAIVHRENNPASTATAQEDLQAPVAQQADSIPPEDTELHFEDVPAQVAILMAEDEDTTLSLPTVDTSPDEGDWRSVHIDPELDADQVAELQKAHAELGLAASSTSLYPFRANDAVFVEKHKSRTSQYDFGSMFSFVQIGENGTTAFRGDLGHHDSPLYEVGEVIKFGKVLFDYTNMYNTETGVFSIRETGIYAVSL